MYKEYMADITYIGVAKKLQDDFWWHDIKAEITGESKLEDNRTAQEIIEQTIAMANNANFKRE